MDRRLLLIPDKPDIERDALAACWIEQGGEVLRIDKFWIKPEIGLQPFSLYGFDMFCLILALITGAELISPPDELLLHIATVNGDCWLKRSIRVCEVGAIHSADMPVFIKSLIPKLFPAKVYSTLQELQQATEGLKPEEKLLLSSIISVEKEIRIFVLNGDICDMALYEGEGDVEEARSFALAFLKECGAELPHTFVMDIGFNASDGWFIIEFNATWGAGLNGCDPAKALPAIREATKSKKTIE